MATARKAKGKKSQAISDISGFKVPYKELQTTWEGFRVEPEEYDPKHPQLTPPRNVIDATALFKPRPDTDPENVTVFIGYNYDPFIPIQQRPPIGVPSFGRVGYVSIQVNDVEIATGVAATGAIGTYTFYVTTDAPVSGVAATGAIGTSVLESELTESGVSSTGAIGAYTPEVGTGTSVSGVAATGATGTETNEIGVQQSGLASTGAVEGFGIEGDGVISIIVTGISGEGAVGTVGEEISVSEVIESGVSATGAIGTSSVTVNPAWGEGAWGDATWGE